MITISEPETETQELPMTNQVAKAEPRQEVAARETGSAITPMQMLQIAVEKGADVAQLERLMDLQQRWEADQARKAFVRALAEFKANPPRIVKNKHVAFPSKGGRTEYDHATLDQVSETIGRALSDYGLSHTWKVEQDPDSAAVKVTCVLTHELGHSEQVTMRAMPDDSGGKNLIQQIGSTVTYLQRYTLLSATGLAAADQDDDGAAAGSPPIDAAQKDQLIELIRETDTDTAKFCAFLGVGAIDEIPANRFDQAVAALEKKRTRKES